MEARKIHVKQLGQGQRYRKNNGGIQNSKSINVVILRQNKIITTAVKDH